MRVLEVVRSSGVSAARELAIQRHLLSHVERPREGGAPSVLHLGWVDGDSILLGRYQRRRSALVDDRSDARAAVLRRPTGGRSVRLGAGHLSVTLAMPDPMALLPSDSAAIGPDKILNRYVRGLLAGLQGRGFKAYYFGRDFLSINRRLGGYLSFEIASSGATLVNAVVGVSRATALSEGEVAYPGVGGNRPDPDATTLDEEGGQATDVTLLERSIIEAYVRNQRVEARERSLSPLEEVLLHEREGASAVDGDELADPASSRGWGHSDLKPIACGWLEASVQVVQEHFLGSIRIFGDFMAGSGAITSLERELRLVPLDEREIGLVVDRCLADPRNTLVGVRYPRVILEAVLEAAKRAPPGP